jgi:hypothetical protein
MRRAIRNDLWLMIGFAIAMILFTPGAWATQPDNRPPDNRPPPKDQHHESSANSESTALSGAAAGALAGAIASGGSANGGSGGAGGTGEGGAGGAGGNGISEASNDGNAFKSSSSHFYVSRSLPASANPCITSADAGGGGKSAAAFLGIQILDDNCWKNTLAEQERNAVLKALLKCGAKKYRRSVAYAQPRNKQQGYCVSFVREIYLAEIALELDAMATSHKRALEIIAKQSGVSPEGK